MDLKAYMRYLVFSGQTLNYHQSGKSVNRTPMKHVERTLKDNELFFVESGTLHIRGEEETSLSAGSVAVHLKGDGQGGTSYSENSFYWLHFDGNIKVFYDEEKAKSCAAESGGVYFAETFRPENPDFVVTLLNEINRLFFEADAKRVLGALTYVLICELSRQYASGTARVGGNKRISEIATYIRLTGGKGVTIDNIAEKYGFNARYLSKTFSSVIGTPLGAYIETQRIERAKRLLLSRNDKIKTIAEEVGYEDEFYFMRVFKKRAGTTPTKWRKTFNESVFT